MKKIFVLCWIVPIISIGFNFYISGQDILVFNKILDKQNLNYNRQMAVSDCNKIVYSTR